ncbi:hypothetical protein MML48_4g00001880 [Holotrichia oblita]|uniref:Uncharacterized protein n=1 Tax=Holotrichia oblita TaxID=644536 RepID=A0ACB9T7U1_HOLOL|nr:hypothetical protein MML48_4g00001880 [Holotrichia oblita]
METSDSEYFESADEDFGSDDETQIEKKKDIQENVSTKSVEEVGRLTISNDNKKDANFLLKKDKEILSNEAASSNYMHDTCDKIEKPSHSITEDVRVEGTDNSKLSKSNTLQSYMDQSKSDKSESQIPPAVSTKSDKQDNVETSTSEISATCSFTNTTNIQQSFEPQKSNVENDTENKSKSSGQSNSKSSVIEKPKRPEFGIPPARTTCWFPGTANIQQPFEPHPAYLELMQKQNSNKQNSNLENINKPRLSEVNECTLEQNLEPNPRNKPKRPEYGIPPARTTCWVPGTANVQQPFEPHPAYLELLKAKEEKAKASHTSNLTSDEQPAEKESDMENTFQVPESSKSISKPTITPKASIGKTVKDDMSMGLDKNDWDVEEDWGDFDAFPCENEIKPDKDEENMWEDDDWEPLESQVQDHRKDMEKNQQEEKSHWGGWGNWGLSSVLSTATSLTTQVSQGITNVLETGIGAPDPTELARINKLEKEKIKESNVGADDETIHEKPILGFGLGNLVQGVTKLVETTGTKVISGGLDTLETIGKKTMEVLQENDPGLKKKRAFLKLDDDKPILSQLLREAKEKAEKENKELERKHFAKKANYETLFDDHQGLVHLEALEMLSKQCDIKLQSLLDSASGEVLSDMQETLDQVKELCELPEEDDEENLSTDEIKEKLEDATSEINVKISYNKLISTWQEVESWLTQLNLNICNKNELHQQAIESLAQLTAISVEQFHRAGELLLIKDHRSTADEADSLVQLTTTLTTLIGIVAARFSEKLNLIIAESTEKEEINSLITNVFLEVRYFDTL